ncbi:hypothetical protein C8Q77DRAFT_1099815 [Trametes polyzona]|nr:hypothetical protein C8Q77DRAFT_1099815 [Trametes polyzona]
MTMPAQSSSPLFVLGDSGIPEGSVDHTTVVIIHGFIWHSGIFQKLIPIAGAHNARVVLVNRRDYPGAEPFTKEDRALLPTLSADEWKDAVLVAAAKEKLLKFMEARARELYDFLIELVETGGVSRPNREGGTGGIVVAGWSLAGSWITALLANVASFPVHGVLLSDYVRRVVFFDSPFVPLGLPWPERRLYSPIFDDTIPPEERMRVFLGWISGYFKHGDTLETLEAKTPLQIPQPTASTFSTEEMEQFIHIPPGEPGGSDQILFEMGAKLGLFVTLRERALYLSRTEGDTWRDVEVR